MGAPSSATVHLSSYITIKAYLLTAICFEKTIYERIIMNMIAAGTNCYFLDAIYRLRQALLTDRLTQDVFVMINEIQQVAAVRRCLRTLVLSCNGIRHFYT